MCVGAFEWPNTCQLQHFKFCGYLFSRNRNWGMFRNRKRCHHFTKHVRINGPPTAHYTIMYGKYNSRCDLMSCDVKPLAVRLMCLSIYWLHTTVIRRDRSRGKMIPKIIFILFKAYEWIHLLIYWLLLREDWNI